MNISPLSSIGLLACLQAVQDLLRKNTWRYNLLHCPRFSGSLAIRITVLNRASGHYIVCRMIFLKSQKVISARPAWLLCTHHLLCRPNYEVHILEKSWVNITILNSRRAYYDFSALYRCFRLAVLTTQGLLTCASQPYTHFWNVLAFAIVFATWTMGAIDLVKCLRDLSRHDNAHPAHMLGFD